MNPTRLSIVLLATLALSSTAQSSASPLHDVLAEHRYSCRVHPTAGSPSFIEYVNASSAQEARAKVAAGLPPGWWVDPCNRSGS